MILFNSSFTLSPPTTLTSPPYDCISADSSMSPSSKKQRVRNKNNNMYRVLEFKLLKKTLEASEMRVSALKLHEKKRKWRIAEIRARAVALERSQELEAKEKEIRCLWEERKKLQECLTEQQSKNIELSAEQIFEIEAKCKAHHEEKTQREMVIWKEEQTKIFEKDKKDAVDLGVDVAVSETIEHAKMENEAALEKAVCEVREVLINEHEAQCQQYEATIKGKDEQFRKLEKELEDSESSKAELMEALQVMQVEMAEIKNAIMASSGSDIWSVDDSDETNIENNMNKVSMRRRSKRNNKGSNNKRKSLGGLDIIDEVDDETDSVTTGDRNSSFESSSDSFAVDESVVVTSLGDEKIPDKHTKENIDNRSNVSSRKKRKSGSSKRAKKGLMSEFTAPKLRTNRK